MAKWRMGRRLSGPSPRARGKRFSWRQPGWLAGTIPASAGETGVRGPGRCLARDHPRERGGNERRIDWAVWWLFTDRPWSETEPLLRRWVLRAARVYAATACEKAGLADQAATLRALPDDASFDAIARAARAVRAAWAAVGAAWAADRAASAADSAVWADRADRAARAASAADRAARAAEIDQHIAEIRELFPAPPWTESTP